MIRCNRTVILGNTKDFVKQSTTAALRVAKGTGQRRPRTLARKSLQVKGLQCSPQALSLA